MSSRSGGTRHSHPRDDHLVIYVAAVTRITIKQKAVADHLAMVHSALVAGKPRDGTCESSAVLAFNVNEVRILT